MRRVAGSGYDLLEDEPRGSGRYEREEERDLVLGIPALLGIFLAVSLVCAVCFGYGYSRGHGPSMATAKPKLEPQPLGGRPLNPDETVSEPALALPARAKPDPGTAARSALAAAEAPSELPGMPPSASEKAAPHAAASAASNAAEPIALRPTAAPAASAGTLMVQIAAVSHAADANTLAEALRHDGFHAVVRNSPADPLFHVQVGPFASFDSAKSMKTKLVDSGYNAFIKP